MLAELGIVHTIFIFSVLILIAFTAFCSSSLLPQSKLLLVLAISSCLVPASIQEITYIRPVFYIHTIFWGTLAGLPYSKNSQVLGGAKVKL